MAISESIKSILIGLGWSVLATAGVAVLVYWINKLYVRLIKLVRSWRGTRIKDVRIQSLKLLTSDRIADGLIALLGIVRVVIFLSLVYFYVPMVLSFFPAGRGAAAVLMRYALAPIKGFLSAIANYVPNVVSIAVILLITRYSVKLVRLIFYALKSGTIALEGFHSDWAEPTYMIVRFFIIIIAAVAIFPYLPGASSPAFKGISVFLGVLFSLGSTSATANVVAGLVITYMRPFHLGERVKIGETMGDIIEKSFLVTRVRTIKNEEVSIPNSAVLASHIINYSASAKTGGLILHTSVSIGYSTPWRQVHELLISAAQATTHILKDPAPFVLQTALDDFYVSYQINAYTDQPSLMVDIYSELRQNIQDRFNAAGVEILSPHYTSLRDGNNSSVPAKDEKPPVRNPGFRILRGEI